MGWGDIELPTAFGVSSTTDRKRRLPSPPLSPNYPSAVRIPNSWECQAWRVFFCPGTGAGGIMHRMAVLVDGGFYLKRAKRLRGEKSPQERANEMDKYCREHVRHEGAELYRIFYYDCDPVGKKAFHPFLGRTVDLRKRDQFRWKTEFFACLAKKRKLAIRKGQELEGSCEYVLKRDVSSALVRGKRELSSLSEDDFVLDVQQKGVDIRIGLDLALIAHRGFADQVVVITGDSDFVPAAKYARRNGLDFILDPMWHDIRPELSTHVDGMFTPWPNPRKAKGHK